jgi:hypothetical protein
MFCREPFANRLDRRTQTFLTPTIRGKLKIPQRAAAKIAGLQVVLMAPSSNALLERWQKICPVGTEFRCLPGLPEALDESLWTFLG